MRGDVENPEHHFRPRRREETVEEMEASFSERGMFDELEFLARTPELRRAWDRVRTAAIRGAAAGVLIKGGLHTLTFVMYLLSRIRGKGRQRVTTLPDALRDTVLHTCFLAALGSSYTAVDEGIALIFGKASTQRWRALVAGLIAGQSLRMTGSNRRHYSLATYILLRGLTLLVRTGNKPSAPPALRALLRPTRLQHGDTLLMCLAASQILYSFIMAPSSLPPAYVRFISRMGSKDVAVWAAMREHALRNSLGLPPGPLRALRGTPLDYLNARPGRLRRTPCEFFHPGQSCASHAVGVMPQAFGTSLAVYVPFYLVSSVLVHRTALLARPKELLPKMALAILRSSAFLSAYIAAAFAGACTGFCVSGINTGTVIATSVWAGGLATLLEKKSRRMELAMYCAARALEAFIRCCWIWSADGSSNSNSSGPTIPHLAGAGRHVVGLPPLTPPPSVLRALHQQGHHHYHHLHSHQQQGHQPSSVGPRRGVAAAAAAAAAASGGGLRLDVLMFSLGCGAIMHCYSDSWGQHRDVFRSKYLNVLDFIFGNEGVQQGSISHVPTNREIVSTVGRRLRTMSRGVLSSGDYSASFTTSFSPLPQSAAPSQGEGLGQNSGPGTAGGDEGGSFAAAGGHIHHGGHGYSRYLQQQQQQQRQQHHQQLLLLQQQHGWAGKGNGGGGSGSSGNGLLERGGANGESPRRRLCSSLSSGATAAAVAACKPPVAPPGASYSCNGVAMAAAASAAAGMVVREAAARLEGEQQQQRQRQEQQVSGTGTAAAAVATPGKSAGDSGSPSSSEWEDVWAATSGSSPNADGSFSVAAAAAASGTAPPTRPMAANGAAGPLIRTSSAPLVGDSVVHHSPFAVASKHLDEVTAAAVAVLPPSALGWAARLVAEAFHRATGGGATTGASPSGNVPATGTDVEAAPPSPAGLSQFSAEIYGGGGIWGGFGKLNSMRRISTAPHGLQDSAKAMLLLTDPTSEHCGRGRSSYKELQRLSVGGGGGGALTAAAAADGDVPSPASMSSSPGAAAAAAALPPPRASLPCNGSDPSSPSVRHVAPPSRARPVPVPNASSRTPSFRPRGPFAGGGGARSAAGGAPDAAASVPPLAPRSLPTGGSSLSSSLNRGFNSRSVHLGVPSTNSHLANNQQHARQFNSRRSCGNAAATVHDEPVAGPGYAAAAAAAAAAAVGVGSGGSSALTFELNGALSHPSPVPKAPIWPRMSVDSQAAAETTATASCPTPTAGEGVLAAEGGSEPAAEATVQHALAVEVEVQVVGRVGV